MSIQRLQSHWGFSRMPFGRDLAPSMLHRHPGHSEAIARISWCVDQCAIGVITGEVGAGKTVAIRAAATAPLASVVIVTFFNSTIVSTSPGYNLKPARPHPLNVAGDARARDPLDHPQV